MDEEISARPRKQKSHFQQELDAKLRERRAKGLAYDVTPSESDCDNEDIDDDLLSQFDSGSKTTQIGMSRRNPLESQWRPTNLEATLRPGDADLVFGSHGLMVKNSRNSEVVKKSSKGHSVSWLPQEMSKKSSEDSFYGRSSLNGDLAEKWQPTSFRRTPSFDETEEDSFITKSKKKSPDSFLGTVNEAGEDFDVGKGRRFLKKNKKERKASEETQKTQTDLNIQGDPVQDSSSESGQRFLKKKDAGKALGNMKASELNSGLQHSSQTGRDLGDDMRTNKLSPRPLSRGMEETDRLPSQESPALETFENARKHSATNLDSDITEGKKPMITARARRQVAKSKLSEDQSSKKNAVVGEDKKTHVEGFFEGIRKTSEDKKSPLENRSLFKSKGSQRNEAPEESRKLFEREPEDDLQTLVENRKSPAEDLLQSQENKRNRKSPAEERLQSQENKRNRKSPAEERLQSQENRRNRKSPAEGIFQSQENRRNRKSPAEDRLQSQENRRTPIENGKSPVEGKQQSQENRRTPVENRKSPFEGRKTPVRNRTLSEEREVQKSSLSVTEDIQKSAANPQRHRSFEKEKYFNTEEINSESQKFWEAFVDDDISSLCEEIIKERPVPSPRKYAVQRSDKEQYEKAIDEVTIAQTEYTRTMQYIEPDTSRKSGETVVAKHKPKPRYPAIMPSLTYENMPAFDNTTTLRQNIFEEWRKQKLAFIKQQLKEKKRENDELEKKKEKEKKEDMYVAEISYKAWMDKKQKTFFKDKVKQKKEQVQKELEKVKKKEEKLLESDKCFNLWKERKDAFLKEKQKQKKEEELQKNKEQEEFKIQRKKMSQDIYKFWKKGKDKLVVLKKKEEKQKLGEEESQATLRYEREMEVLGSYELWLETKEKQQEKQKKETRQLRMLEDSGMIEYRPPWSPASRTIPMGR